MASAGTSRIPERIRAHHAATILGVELRTVQALAARGELPGAAKIGGLWTFDESALRRFAPKYAKKRAKAEPVPRKKEDTIYVIQCGGHLKIGYTQNLSQRLHALKTSNAQEIELIGSFSGTKSDEKKLHQQFAHLRAKGEWFHAESEVRSWILKTFGIRIYRYGSFHEPPRPARVSQPIQPRRAARHVGKHG